MMLYKEYSDKAIQTFEYETTMLCDGNIIGTCELGKATIQLLNDSNKYSTFKDSWIKTVHGSFYIYKVEPVQEKVSIKLECYDIKYKLDTPYDSKKHTFPCSLKQWRNSIFDSCGVEYDDNDFPNSKLYLYKEPYIENGSSNRTIIKQIAQAGASAVITDSSDKFYFAWFENIEHKVDDWIELTTEKQRSNPINCVVLGRGNTEDNVYYPQNKPNFPVEFRIDNNYILDPQDTNSVDDLRYTTRIPIYNQVNGFSYLIFSMRSQSIHNKLSIKLGQKVRYLDIWGNELLAYVMTKKIKWLGGNLADDDNYEIILSADKVSETTTDLSYSSNIKNDVLRVERKTDKNSGAIEDVIEKQGHQQSQMSQINQTLDTIQQQISGEYGMDREVLGTNQVFIENAQKYYPLELKIKGYSNTKNLLYPGTFYPGTGVVPIAYKEQNSSKITICVDSQDRNNPTENLKEYVININEPLRSLGTIRDEFEMSIEDGTIAASITRYLRYTGSQIIKLDKPVIEQITAPKIELLAHANYVYIKEQPNYQIYVRYLIYSTMNEFYTPKLVFQTTIKQTEDSIMEEVLKKADDNEIRTLITSTAGTWNLELSKKTDKDKVITTINASTEDVKIQTKKLDVDAIATFTNSKLSNAGSTVINGSNITTGAIDASKVIVKNLDASNITAGTLTGDKIRGGTISGTTINTDKDLTVGNNAYIGQNQTSNADVTKFLYFCNNAYIKRYIFPSGKNYLLIHSDLNTRLECGSGNINVMDGAIQMSHQANISSDKRLKKNIKNLDVSWIDDLKVKEFEYKNTPNKKQIGLIAQDYIDKEYSKYFLNETENEKGDNYYSICYANITNALIQYCQEMNQRIKKLEQENEVLKSEKKNN